MLASAGNLLFWSAGLLLTPLMALPLVVLVGGGDRMRSIAIWLALSVGAVAAGFAFSHFAVDLPAFDYSWRHLAWLAGVTMLVGGLGLAMEPRFLCDTLSAVFRMVTERTGRAITWLVFAMALVQFAVVILRYVFGLNFIAMQESVTYMHGAVFLLAAGYALLTDDHVRVDIFYREAPPRRKALVDLIGVYLFLFPFCLLILWTAAPYVAQAWSVREGSTEQSGIQGVFLLKTLIPMFAVLLAMAGFVAAARAAQMLKAGPPGEAA